MGDGVMPKFDGLMDPRIKIGASTKSGSAGVTRNRALSAMSIDDGHLPKWIGFLDDDDRLAPTYVEHLKQHADDYPWAEVVVFRMNDPRLGVLPPADGRLRHGTVGISFAMRAELAEEHAFIAEDWSQNLNEDWAMIAEFQENQRRIFLSPHTDYLVRNA